MAVQIIVKCRLHPGYKGQRWPRSKKEGCACKQIWRAVEAARWCGRVGAERGVYQLRFFRDWRRAAS